MAERWRKRMASILRLPMVKERTGLSRSSIYAFIARGTFPAPVSLGARAVGWDSGSIDAWIATRIGQGREAKMAESPPTAIRLDANTSTETATEPRLLGKFGCPGPHLRLGLGMGMGKSQH